MSVRPTIRVTFGSTTHIWLRHPSRLPLMFCQPGTEFYEEGEDGRLGRVLSVGESRSKVRWFDGEVYRDSDCTPSLMVEPLDA